MTTDDRRHRRPRARRDDRDLSAIDAALLRSLPHADPWRLVGIYTEAPPSRFPFWITDYLALRSQQTQIEPITAYAVRGHFYFALTQGPRAGLTVGSVLA